MTADWFNNVLIAGSTTCHNGIWVDHSFLNKKFRWSFADEWKEHARTKQQKTWDQTATQRLEQFYIETRTSPEEIINSIVLDAGCGNGQLTEAIAGAGANVIGIDVHPHLPANGSSANLHFVQADFDTAPFKKDTFDIIIANGSIHHTKNTLHSFQSLAGLVKQNGKLYVWVYKNPTGWWKKFLLWWLDLFRFFICRFPPGLQKFCVNVLTGLFFMLSRIRKGQNSKRTKEEIRINVYDAFTPRYRHYHDPAQVARWFYQCGFTQPVLSHLDNPIGFGMMAVKNRDL
jgi:SAM-dependent methyltransferase